MAINEVISGVLDSAGNFVAIDSMAQTMTYNNGQVASISATDGTHVWTQTVTYSGSNPTYSQWVRTT